MLRNKQKPVMYHVRQAVAHEKDSIKRKKIILATSGATILFTLILSVFHLLRYQDATVTAEDNREAIKEGYGFQTLGGKKALVYNQMCLELGQNKESGEYQDLIDDIASQTRSQEDVQRGT